jgi:hypothetical protein
MTERQLRARIDRLGQLVHGFAKEYTRCQYTHGPHALELMQYATKMQIAYTVLGEAQETLQRIVGAMKRAEQPVEKC